MPTQPFRSLCSLVLGLAPLAAGSPDFNPLMAVARTTWPEKQHLAVVGNYAAIREDVQALAAAAAPGSRITVVDARTVSSLPAALQILDQRKADFLVMMPRDPIFFEGGVQGTSLVRGLARLGMPSVGTAPVAVRQGAVFAIGARTGGELLVTERLQGTVSVILPSRQAALRPVERYTASNGVTVEVATLP